MRFGTIVEEVLGNGALTGARTRDVSNGTSRQIELAGLFVYVGLAPATAWLGDRLILDAAGRVPVDGDLRTRLQGVFAAGTVCSGSVGRAAAAGNGAAAVLNADQHWNIVDW